MEEIWTNAAWLAQAHAWIEEGVRALGARRTEPIEQPHVRQWSTALRVPTSCGVLWFKANAPALAHEAAIVDLLARSAAGGRLRARRCRPHPWVDADARWRLPTARDPRGGARSGSLAGHPPSLRGAAARPGRRCRRARCARGTGSAAREPPRTTRAAARRGRGAGGRGAAAAGGVRGPRPRDVPRPRGDRHPGDHPTRRPARRAGIRPRRPVPVLDWGDSCISHPFFSMSVTLEGFLAWGLDDVEGSVDVSPFRDAYLAPFASYGGRDELEAACATAVRLGWICRALNVHMFASSLEPASTREWLARVRVLLRMAVSGTPTPPGRA